MHKSYASLGEMAERCYRFYTDDPAVPWPRQLPPRRPLLPRPDSLQASLNYAADEQLRQWRAWNPWIGRQDDIDQFDDLAPYIADEKLLELCRSIISYRRAFLQLNKQAADALAVFFGLPAPETEDDFRKLRAQAEDYRRQVGAAWSTDPEVQPLIARLQIAVARMKSLGTQLREKLQPLYARLYTEELGNQRAGDLIDQAVEEPNPRRAIRLLNKALSYGQTGLYASSAYTELGGRYSDLGDAEKAIEYYTKSLEASDSPDAYTLFWRGQLYYEQEQWEQAQGDLERALSVGLCWPDSDQAREYLSDIHAHKHGR